MTDAAGLVDSLAGDRLVVFGSLPPEGRDLDLLVPAAVRSDLERGLRESGFLARPPHWARFHDCTVDAVELHDPQEWNLPAAEIEALFADAIPLPGRTNLVAPAPHHELLILARRLGGRETVLSARRRARIDRALQAGPAVWEQAARRAGAWGATARLEWLAAAHGHRDARGVLRRAWAERLRALGPGGVVAAAGRRARRRRGLIVALSGLDGSGKSTQCEALRDTLDRLGTPARLEWTSIVAHPWLYPASERIKGVLRAVLRRRPAAPSGPDEGPRSGVSHDPLGVAFRSRGGAITFAWTTLLVVANSRWHRRATRPARRRGEVVVCDRYTLDSRVQLRYAYGEGRGFRFQTWLMQRLSPRPDLAFLLAVPPETALRRNQEYTPQAAARRARLYEEERSALGFERLDGERPPDELCAQLARTVWEALPRGAGM